MPRRGENIRKRSDGRWESRYLPPLTDGTKRKYVYFYGKTYNEVKRKRFEYVSSNHEAVTAVKSDIITLDSAFDEWLCSKRTVVKASTVSNYMDIYEKHICPAFGNLSIFCITSEQINNFTYSKQQCQNISSKYLHDILTILKSILCFSKSRYKISLDISEMSIPRAVTSEVKTLSADEQRKLSEYLLNDMNDYSKFGVLLCLYTGMRIGEICALRWSDIFTEYGYIFIRRTVYRIRNSDDTSSKTILITDTPKTACSVRKIPMNSFVTKLFEKIRRCSSDDYFLTGSGSFIEPRTYQYRFKKYLSEAGVYDINFHALRHTFATNCVYSGCDIKSLSEILGHSSVQITLDKYVHSSMQNKREQLDKMTVYCK